MVQSSQIGIGIKNFFIEIGELTYFSNRFF